MIINNVSLHLESNKGTIEVQTTLAERYWHCHCRLGFYKGYTDKKQMWFGKLGQKEISLGEIRLCMVLEFITPVREGR